MQTNCAQACPRGGAGATCAHTLLREYGRIRIYAGVSVTAVQIPIVGVAACYSCWPGACARGALIMANEHREHELCQS
jgi:proline racemase